MPPLNSWCRASFYIWVLTTEESKDFLAAVLRAASRLSRCSSRIGVKLSTFAMSFANWDAKQTSEFNMTSTLWQLDSPPS